MNDADYQEVLAGAATDAAHFRGLTFSGRPDGKRVSARLIRLRNEPAVQVSETADGRLTTRTVAWTDWPAFVRERLKAGHSFLHVRRDDGDWHVKITRKGRVLMTRGKVTAAPPAPIPAHDREKVRSLNPANAADFLRSLDALDEKGGIRPSMQAKYRQINGFLDLLAPLLPEKRDTVYRICDCGCGAAHLSFALYHYLNQVRGWTVVLTGVDRNRELIAKNNAWRDRLGWTDLHFETADLAAYTPAEPPDLVLSLHACDTATDLALARGAAWKAGVILSAPCCQHELHHALASEPLQALLRHGILRERLADLVTDALRAAALRLCGYSVHVVEFAAAADTGRNILIRAVRQNRPPDPRAADEYRALKAFWNVTPAIEGLLPPNDWATGSPAAPQGTGAEPLRLKDGMKRPFE